MRVLIWFLALCSVAVSIARPVNPPPRARPGQNPKPAPSAVAHLEEGEIEGAKYTWIRPVKWNHCLLLLAHGQRPETAPLIADLFPEHAAYKALVDDGWIVAKTSFRRNGVIVADAITDLENLRAEIVRRFGKPTRVLIEGESMGGYIAMLLAERIPEETPRFHGVVAIDPALSMREPNSDLPGLNMVPQLPIVFLSTRTEFEGPRHYAEMKMPGAALSIRPLLLRVNRDGHVNVNQAERLTALRTLNAWLDNGVESLPKPAEGKNYIDATHNPEPVASRVFLDADRRGFTAHVTEVSRVYGNVLLDAQPADFEAVGLSRNTYFQLTLREHTFRVFYGKDFSSVKRGEWVTFVNADGFFWLARNFQNAADATQAEVGDLVQIRRYESTPKDEESGAQGR